MTATTIRPAYGDWPGINQRLREAVADLTDEQLARSPAPDRWPLWATVGHLACQRVFWLCDAAGEPGAGSTPFPNAAFDCPGDDDLDHALDADALADALDASFRIVDGCLDRWTPDMLNEVLRHPEWGESWAHPRGWVIARVYAHDVYHCAEINEILGAAGLPQVDPWG